MNDKKDLERLQEFMDNTCSWSDKEFDNSNFTKERSIPILYHLKEEVDELIYALKLYFELPNEELFRESKYELADCMTLLLDCATHMGLKAEDVMRVCEKKLNINKKRTWAPADENGVCRHVELN